MLHKHNMELYERVQSYIHNQTSDNAIALVEWCQREGGKFTGFYATTYVSRDDLARDDEENREKYEAVTHEQMKEVAGRIGDIEVEYGAYWEVISEWVRENL